MKDERNKDERKNNERNKRNKEEWNNGTIMKETKWNNNERNEEDEIIIPPQLFEISKKMLFYKCHSVKQMKKY